MIPYNYINVLVDCYNEATGSAEFWKLSGIIEELMDYDSCIDSDVIEAEFQEIRICMMKHFKHKEENEEVS